MLSPTCATDSTLVALAAFLTSNGAWLSPKLQLSCDDASVHGRGVKAIAPIDEGEAVASVPFTLLLSTDAARKEDPGLDALASDANLVGTNLAAVALLRQREAGRRWRPFALALPSVVNTTLTWSAAELAELQASDLARQTARRADAIRRHHAAITRALAATGGTAASLPLPDFQWALSTVWARAHTVSLPNGPPEGCLAPLLDLFNAETRSPSMQPAETTIRKVGGEGVDGSGSDGALTIRAARSLSIGEEATVPYGHHNPRDLSNARALLDYGFCVDDKVDEYGEDVALPLTADNCTAGGLIATEALEALHLPTTSNGNNNGHDGGRHPPPRIGHGHDPIPPELNAFARVCVMSADVAANTKELAIKGTDPKLFQRLGAPLGHWDQKAAAALARHMRWRLHEYATTSDEDVALLQKSRDGAAPPKNVDVGRWRCALRLRLHEKRILEERIAQMGGLFMGVKPGGSLRHDEL